MGRFLGVRESTMPTTEKNKKAIMECFAPLLYSTPRDVNIGKIETELTLWVADGIRWKGVGTGAQGAREGERQFRS